jgi:hypothetical protein
MNAAEITEKLGLHSLTRRAWVRLLLFILAFVADRIDSTFNLHVQLLAMGCMKVSSG